MQTTFQDTITSEAQLREILGEPSPSTRGKLISTLDSHCLAFIAKSPFMLIASAGEQGKVDVSPKGDPAGFVQVLDERTLAIPERLGNRLADTLLNVLACPYVGLLFMVPGRQETLRVRGRAQIVRDPWLLERMAVGGRAPPLATVVSLDWVFFHCGKCVIRSRLWSQQDWPDAQGLSSLAEAVKDQARLSDSVEAVQSSIDASYRDRLY